jgi:hypothetical protein
MMAAVAITAMATVPATPATAQDAANFDVTATVAAKCNYTGGTIAFGTVTTDSSTGLLNPGQSASSGDQAAFYCNGSNTTVELSHVAMSTAASASGFVNSIDFTPAVNVGGSEVLSGDQAAGSAFGARSGTLVVRAKDLTAAGKVIAGDYAGSITLTLTPAS